MTFVKHSNIEASRHRSLAVLADKSRRLFGLGNPNEGAYVACLTAI
jgi:hypothetical protein